MSFVKQYTETRVDTIKIPRPGKLIITAIGGGGGCGGGSPRSSGGNGGVVKTTYENIPNKDLTLKILIGGGGKYGETFDGIYNDTIKGGGGGGGLTLVRDIDIIDNPVIWVMAGGGGGGGYELPGGNCNEFLQDGTTRGGAGGAGGTLDASGGCGFGGGNGVGGGGGFDYESDEEVGSTGGNFGSNGIGRGEEYAGSGGGGSLLGVKGINGGVGIGGGDGGINGGGDGGANGCGGGGGGCGGGGSGGIVDGNKGAGGAGGSYGSLPTTFTEEETPVVVNPNEEPPPDEIVARGSIFRDFIIKEVITTQTDTSFNDPITLFDNDENPLKYGYGGLSDESRDGSGGYVRIEYIPYAVVCFPAKTPIKTDQGVFNIETIDHKIHTINKKKIIAISRTISPEKHLVCIEPNALGQNCPSKITIITLMHGVYINNKLVRAKELVNRKGIYRIPYNKEILYNVVMEKHNKMGVNNMICETMNPGSPIAKIYIKQHKEKLAQAANTTKIIVTNNKTINK